MTFSSLFQNCKFNISLPLLHIQPPASLFVLQKMWRPTCALSVRVAERGVHRIWETWPCRFCSHNSAKPPSSPSSQTTSRTQAEKQRRKREREKAILSSQQNVGGNDSMSMDWLWHRLPHMSLLTYFLNLQHASWPDWSMPFIECWRWRNEMEWEREDSVQCFHPSWGKER